MENRIIIIGANAAGAKAAARARRMDPRAEIVLIDKGAFISYGACGIPYYVSGTVTELKELMSTPFGVERGSSFFRKFKGVEILTGTTAVGIDRTAKAVTLHDRESGQSSTVRYDKLILATGSTPAIHPLYNLGCSNILVVKTMADAKLLKEKAVPGKAVCIVGGGLIGLEMAEALMIRGLRVTVVEMCDQLLPGVLDSDMAKLLERHLEEKGVRVITSCQVFGFDGEITVERAITNHGEVPADMVVLAPGVIPDVLLAEEAGLQLGVTGAIAVNERLQTSDPDIYACGDCVEATHLIAGVKVYVPLASTANKQGRVAGSNAAGGETTFAGVLGTIIVKVFDFNAGKTGLTEEEAKAAGYQVETVLSSAHDRAHFFPGATLIVLKLLADRATGLVLGLQAVGPGGVDKRIDVAATAMTFGATVDQLAQLDLAYSPPFSSAMDNLIVAADIMRNKLAGHARGITAKAVMRKIEAEEDFLLLDVRSPGESAEYGLKGAIQIPLDMLREKLGDLPKDKEIIAFCKSSSRGYEAQKILDAAGFPDVKFLDGGMLTWPNASWTNL